MFIRPTRGCALETKKDRERETETDAETEGRISRISTNILWYMLIE